MKIKKTFVATISVGFKDDYDGNEIHTLQEAYEICEEYSTKTATPLLVTEASMFNPRHGQVPAISIQMQSMPTSFRSKYDIIENAMELGKIFMIKFKQNKVLVVTSDQTFLLDKNDTKEILVD